MTRSFLFIGSLLLVLYMNVYEALDCKLNPSDPYHVAYTITVDKLGKGNFTSVQRAIDSIPNNNAKWIRIQISAGQYSEHISIPPTKPCIFFDGGGLASTVIQQGGDQSTPTFFSYAENIVVEGITFKNTYNLQPGTGKKIEPAFAVNVLGDKNVFYRCGFVGVQDTLFDHSGRHYFQQCYIEGAVDFICGYGQSIYESCTITVNSGKYTPGIAGYITAQKKQSAAETNGFVFKSCTFNGNGNAYLGRAWGAYSTVIIANSQLWGGVVPQGWDAWTFAGHEANLFYAEAGNSGTGSVTSKRVLWMKKLSPPELKKFTDISFIDSEGWLAKIPNIYRSSTNLYC